MKPKKTIYTIGMHLAGWVLLYFLPPLVLQTQVKPPANFGDYMYWAIVITCFYVNYLWLVPKFLSKRRFTSYFLWIFIMLSATYFANEIYVRHVIKVEEARREAEGEKNTRPRKKYPRYRGYNSALFCFALLALGTSIKVTNSWYENEKQRKEMENQKLGAELSLLKSQINPHFFFNTLNSIYSLAIIKSDKTPEAVIKLSEIMRYIIYDTERKLVPLSKEVEYIANYIELQRLRLREDMKIDFTTRLGDEETVIEPLLLLPFVENAFKHGVDAEKGGRIKIEIIQTGNDLHFHVENPLVDNDNQNQSGQSGIGLTNTLKRLELLYQNNFSIHTGPTKGKYVVELVLKLKENELSDS
ncbi:MAG: histidine kinase [Bacteroidales bacterium]|nr:histidine kinase [Bacteroidales bacterium]